MFPAIVVLLIGLTLYLLGIIGLSFFLAEVSSAITAPFGWPPVAWWQVCGALIVLSVTSKIAWGSK